MGTDRRVQPALQQIFVEFPSDTSCAETLAVLVDEKRFLVKLGGSNVRPSQFQVFLDRDNGGLADRGGTLFLALASHANRLADEIDVGKIQVDQFAHADARREKDFQHRPISRAKQRVAVRRVQEPRNIIEFQIFRQALFLFGRANRRQRMFADIPSTHTELVEAP